MSGNGFVAKEVVAHIDGGSRGNPGPAAYGVVVSDAEGALLASFSKFLGRATNNVAEYQGLLGVLNYALEAGHTRLKVISDSELLTRQITGQYKVRNPDLKILHQHARQLIQQFDSFSIQHVLREHNREADGLVNEALDQRKGRNAPSPAAATPGSPRSEPLRASATYQQGFLNLHQELPLKEGEEIIVEIRRRK